MPIIPPFMTLPSYILGFNYIHRVDAEGIRLVPLHTLEDALDLSELFRTQKSSDDKRSRYKELDSLPTVTINDTLEPSREAADLYEKSLPFALYVRRPDSGTLREGMIDVLQRHGPSILEENETIDFWNGKEVQLTPDLRKRIEGYFNPQLDR